MSLLGKRAPDFSLENTAGQTVTLHETLERGPTVVVMFRAAWCSFCAEQLQTYSNLAYDLWRNHDTDVLPVSSDSVGNLREMRDRYDLRLQLLSDSEQTVTEAYTEMMEHAWRPDYSRSGTFVVDQDGIVRYAHLASSPPDRTYANYVRYFIEAGFEDRWDVAPDRVA